MLSFTILLADPFILYESYLETKNAHKLPAKLEQGK